MRKVHKVRRSRGVMRTVRTYCGRVFIGWTDGLVTGFDLRIAEAWKDVTCKRCLKAMKKEKVA
jgi:hypothetical protein